MRGAGEIFPWRLTLYPSAAPGSDAADFSPRNLFPLQAAERVTLLAAGIGITPLYAMALRLEAEGVPFTLHYYLKNRAQGAFIRELQRRFSAESVVIHCSCEGHSARQDLAVTLNSAHTGYPIYLCGPEDLWPPRVGSPWNRAGRKR
jgi:vanillate O-demethylase ferredoxin subunit